MLRKIVHIDQELCNGCGLCATACHEGAIEIVNGKAQLISDKYCDGLGDCLPACPTEAIKIIEREADAYSEDEVLKLQAQQKENKDANKDTIDVMPCGCPGTAAKKITRAANEPKAETKETNNVSLPSQLRQWPVQLRLINPQAEYLQNADLLIAADCTAYAYGNFHEDFIKDHVTIIGCPKLDDNKYNAEKLAAIIAQNNIRSITVVKMEVPCCNGIVQAVKEAMLSTQTIVPYREVTIGIDGSLK
ncbi:4Fe-4S dicluster domain-containing protein [Bacillota bacterium LX-D]|nr:4Fe-4S dicluster domain-containing protein [Bacillota bacterium LX-D]